MSSLWERRFMRRSRRTARIALACSVLGAVALSAASGSEAAKVPSPTPAAVYPNVVEEVPSHLGIQNDHQREWLRFSTTHINLGPGNLQIRGGGQIAPCTIDGTAYEQCTVATQEILDSAGNVVMTHPAGVSFFHPEHNHWHQSGVAEFKIMRGSPVTGTGVEMAKGVKITFCFVDVEFTGVIGSSKKALPRTYFECNGDLQGLAAGWADEYHQSTPLQELEVTNFAEGDYYLTHQADPDNHWLEGPTATSPGEMDNFTWVKFHLDRMTGENPSVTVTDHSPCTGVVCGFGGNP
jgi:Lysyl oxidase